jgi:hypothetical protein
MSKSIFHDDEEEIKVKKIIRTLFPAVAMAAGLLLLGRVTQAETLNFQTLNNAGDPFFNQLLGINNAGTIAGYFGDGTVLPNKGYTLVPPSSYTNENFPGSVQTQVVGINNSVTPQTTVGFYIDGNGNNFGFVDLGGTFTQVNDPSTGTFNGITTNQLLGVNGNDVAAGFYVDSTGLDHGYLYSFSGAPTFTAVTLPSTFGAVSTVATGINDGGVIAGFFTDGTGAMHGFIDNAGTFTQLDDPSLNATNTMVLGLNNEGQFVGSYVDENGETQGFIYNIGTNSWQTVSDPNSSAIASFGVTGTTINGINDLGDVVGFYSDGLPADGVNGFLATPTPEPASFFPILLGGVFAMGFRRLMMRRHTS